MNKRKLSIMLGIVAAVVLSLFAVRAYAAPQVNYINVTTTTDELNLSGQGTGSGCSLREAIASANENEAIGGCTTGSDSVDDVVNIKPGTYKITLAGRDGDTPDIGKGDFDVQSDMRLQGAGRGLTFIDAQSKDRIFDLQAGTRVEISSMTLRHGDIAVGEQGSAIRSEGNETDLNYLIVENNTNGAAIYNDTGDISLYRMVVQNNDFGSNPGPGGLGSFGVLRINQSLFYNNHGFGGGAIDANNFTLIVNSTLSGNKAEYRGGGIEFGSASYPVYLDLSNVTITGNHANLNNQFSSGGGGGISSWDVNDQVFMRNSIVAGNVDEGIKTQGTVFFSPDCVGSFTSDGYNLIGNDSNCDGFANGSNHDKVGTNNAPLDPKLGPLAKNGGYTNTHALLSGSPAIDAGNFQAGCEDRDGNPIVVDQRGYARPINGDGQPGTYCDMGAFEAGSTAAPTPTPTTQSCDTKPAAATLTTPANGANVTRTHVSLDWDGPNCATKYKVVVRQDSKKGIKADKHTVGPTSYITTKLKRNHTYYWNAKACNDHGCTKSEWFSFNLIKK